MVSVTNSLAPPLEAYLALVRSGQFSADPEQRKAVDALDRLWHQIQSERQGAQGIQRLFRRITPSHQNKVQGIYLWGGVGRGKTWLMDLFFESLPVRKKRRIHFHRFMQRIHEELRLQADLDNPLPRVAEKWSEQIRLLCLDEFFVADIGDAMLLSGLLEALFEKGVTLVTTSNSPPGDLYRDGLQRAKFLPAIALLENNCEVIQVGGETDYRLRILEQSTTYRHPLSESAEADIEKNYEQISCGSDLKPRLTVNGRPLNAKRRSDGVAWFDFKTLCDGPRGSADYIELARSFNTILISKITVMGKNDADIARRFVTMIDEFYDRNVKLLVTAESGINDLYTGKRLDFEFQRTASRLTEMQSHDYLARPHLS